jgi:hypothetical protein
MRWPRPRPSSAAPSAPRPRSSPEVSARPPRDRSSLAAGDVRRRELGSGTVTPVWVHALTVVAAVLAAVAAVAVPLTTHLRRPRLSIVEDADRIHTRLEGPQGQRSVDQAPRRQPAAPPRGPRRPRARRALSRVPAGGYSGDDGEPRARLAEHGGPGGRRRRRLRRGPPTRGLWRPRAAHPRPSRLRATAGRGQESLWELSLSLAMHAQGRFISNFREILPAKPNGYTVRLLIGADDGAARRFDVDVNWNEQAPDAKAALASVALAVRAL